MILPILKKDHPLLSKRIKIIIDNPKDSKIQKLILDMKETMRANNGIGLAANQIGQEYRLFILEYNNIFKVFINPEIKKYSWRKIEMEEGCLSVPDVWGIVKRPEEILISALNENGEKIEYWAKDMEARIIQHEFDHLNGILFIDRAKTLYKINGSKLDYEKQN